MFDRQDAGIEEYLRPSELIGLDWMPRTLSSAISVDSGLVIVPWLIRPVCLQAIGLYGWDTRAHDSWPAHNNAPVVM